MSDHVPQDGQDGWEPYLWEETRKNIAQLRAMPLRVDEVSLTASATGTAVWYSSAAPRAAASVRCAAS